jgi:hypothetical protein
VPANARAVTFERGHRFAAYPRCSADVFRERRRVRIIGKTALATSVAAVCIVVLPGLGFLVLGKGTTEPGGEWLPFIAAVLLVSSPTTLPITVLAGALAGVVLERQRTPASLWVWLIRTLSVGSIVGALGAPAAPLLFYGARPARTQAPILAMFSLSGAAAGILTGLFVAVWCYRSQRRTRLAERLPC